MKTNMYDIGEKPAVFGCVDLIQREDRLFFFGFTYDTFRSVPYIYAKRDTVINYEK